MRTLLDEVEDAAEEVERRKASRPHVEWSSRYNIHSAMVFGIPLEVAWENSGYSYSVNSRLQPETFANLDDAKAAAIALLRTLADDILAVTEGERLARRATTCDNCGEEIRDGLCFCGDEQERAETAAAIARTNDERDRDAFLLVLNRLIGSAGAVPVDLPAPDEIRREPS